MENNYDYDAYYFSELNSEEKSKLVLDTFSKLPDRERMIIDILAKKLERNFKKKHPNSKFGRVAALELIAMLGVAIVDGRLRLIVR